MKYKIKDYTKRVSNNNGRVTALLGTNELILNIIVNEYTYEGQFTPAELEYYLRGIMNLNTIRLKIKRMYRYGWFKRWLVNKELFERENGKIKRPSRSYFRYCLSERAKEKCEQINFLNGIELYKKLNEIKTEIMKGGY